MRSRVLSLLSVVTVTGLALVAGVLPSAGAQQIIIQPTFEFTVDMVVEGPVPAGTVFTVEVVCDQEGVMDAPGSSAVPITATMTFDETGAPLDANSVLVGPGYTCTATQTVDGGATTTTYACSVVNPVDTLEGPPTFATCTSDQSVQFAGFFSPPDAGADTEGEDPLASGTVTVTNTFVEDEPLPPAVEPDEDEPDVVADVVVATPPFTG